MVCLARLRTAFVDSVDSFRDQSSSRPDNLADAPESTSTTRRRINEFLGAEVDGVLNALQQPTERPARPGDDNQESRRPSSVKFPLERLVQDVGPELSIPSNSFALRSTLEQFGLPDEAAIAKLFLLMSNPARRGLLELDGDSLRTFQHFVSFIVGADAFSGMSESDVYGAVSAEWNFDCFISVILQATETLQISLDWDRVLRSLDCEETASVLDFSSFSSLLNVYSRATKGRKAPCMFFLDDWSSESAQRAILSFSLAKPDLIDWSGSEAFPGARAEDCQSPFSRVNLIQKLVELDAKQLLQVAVSSAPDITLLSLACARPSMNGKLLSQLIVTLLSPQITRFPESRRVLRLLWGFVPALLGGGLLAMWRKDSNAATKVVEIAADCHRLHDLLSSSMPVEFLLHVSMHVYRRRSYRLEHLYTSYFNANSVETIMLCARRMAEMLVSPTSDKSVFQFPVDGVRMLFRSLFTSFSRKAQKHQQQTHTFGSYVEELKGIHEAFYLQDSGVQDLKAADDLGDASILYGSAHLEADRQVARNVEPLQVVGEYALSRTPDLEEFTKDVEDEVNVHFHDIYKGSMTVEQAVSMLHELRVSDSHRDRKVFACMIHTLFDEYRFFKNYPDKELRLTGLLFGSLVQFGLFEGPSLELALERIINALCIGVNRNVPDEAQGAQGTYNAFGGKDEEVTRMLKFGLCALDRFRDRFREWPQFCARIMQIRNLRYYAPELFDHIEQHASAAVPSHSQPSIPSISKSPLSGGSSRNTHPDCYGRGGSAATPVLSAQGIDVPDTPTRERISFIFNNLSAATLPDKKNQFLEFLRDTHIPYFVDYLVEKRATEHNHHPLYIELLELLSPHFPNLYEKVLRKSLSAAKNFLDHEKLSSFHNDDRRVLRTLGAWIGLLTLGRNKPVLMRDLDLKTMCLEAYTQGRLFCVVPFVTKVLLGSKKSKVFGASNPWMIGILSLLKEISLIDDLKLNLKFELPSLLGQLDIDPNLVSPSNLLKDVTQPSVRNNLDRRKSPQPSPLSTAVSPEVQLNYDLPTQNRVNHVENVPYEISGLGTSRAPQLGVRTTGGHIELGNNEAVPHGEMYPMESNLREEMHPIVSSPMSGVSRAMNPTTQSVLSLSQNNSVNGGDGVLLPKFAHLVKINSSFGILQATPSLKQLLPLAIERALRDIIQPVVERSCAIASLTTRELTRKDFANEPNKSKIRRASLQMVQQLAGSLALVTCKEPLRVSMGNHLRSVLASVAVSVDPDIIDQAAQVVCSANLDLGCHIIEKAAKDKAAHDLSDVMDGFPPDVSPSSPYAMMGPPGPEVFRVYADFALIRSTATAENLRIASPPTQLGRSSTIASRGRNPEEYQNESYQMEQRDLNPVGEYPRPVPTRAPEMNSANIATHETGNQVPLVPPENSRFNGTQSFPAGRAPRTRARAPASALASAINKVVQVLNTSSGLRMHQNAQVHSALHPASDDALTTPQVLEVFNALYTQLSEVIAEATRRSTAQSLSLSSLPADHAIHQLWCQIPAAVKRSVTADEAGMAIAQKIFKFLYEDGNSLLHREVHVLLLDGLRETCRRLSKELVIWLSYSEDNKKFHRECTIALLRSRSLIHVTGYDEFLSKAIDGGRNGKALDFAAFLVQRAIIAELLLTPAELALTLETLSKISRKVNSPVLMSAPEGLKVLVEKARIRTGQTPAAVVGESIESATGQASQRSVREVELSDPPGSRELTANLLTEWQRLITAETQNQVMTTFLGHLRSKNLSTEESRERFCRLAVEIVVEVTSTALRASSNPRSYSSDIADLPYAAVESAARLVRALCNTDSSHSSDSTARSFLILASFLTALVRNIRKSMDVEVQAQYKLFHELLKEFSDGVPLPTPSDTDSIDVKKDYSWNEDQYISPANVSAENLMEVVRLVSHNSDFFSTGDGAPNLSNHGTLALFVGSLLMCSPRVAPVFSFCWLHLVSESNVVVRLLSSSDRKLWSLFRSLLVSLLSFLGPHLGSTTDRLGPHVKHFYRGVLRVLLMLLHDFPKFLVDYHYALCDAIPLNCIQLRNLVLAAFPKEMRLPDPFRPDSQATKIPAMEQEPRMIPDYRVGLSRGNLKELIDSALREIGNPGTMVQVGRIISLFVSENRHGGGHTYDMQTIHAVVYYLGHSAISRPGYVSTQIAGAPHTKLLQNLLMVMNAKGRYLTLNVIVNQLRYPNSHTHYFSCLLLHFFKSSPDEVIREQITRILVERLIANRPHPWGLLTTFIELIKNPAFNFWHRPFVRCAPQIESLFENVARFCIGPQTNNASMLAR